MEDALAVTTVYHSRPRPQSKQRLHSIAWGMYSQTGKKAHATSVQTVEGDMSGFGDLYRRWINRTNNQINEQPTSQPASEPASQAGYLKFKARDCRLG